MAAIINGKIKSATLVETIVALVLILVLFAIVSTVLIQTTKSNYTAEQLHAKWAIQQYVLHTDSSRAFFEETIQSGDLLISRKITNQEKYPGAIVLNFVAINKEKKQVGSQNIVYAVK
jgi:type II secretory pathway pseudopilin PulG